MFVPGLFYNDQLGQIMSCSNTKPLFLGIWYQVKRRKKPIPKHRFHFSFNYWSDLCDAENSLEHAFNLSNKDESNGIN